MKKRIELLIIDPQNDFCVPQTAGKPEIDLTGNFGGSLYVKGAEEDFKRLANFINKNLHYIDDIHVTLDSHHLLDVAHPLFWINSKGEHPTPFTLISLEDIENGTWQPINPSWTSRMVSYAKTLKDNNRYQLCIWPPHCLIGTWGHNVQTDIMSALHNWERRPRQVDFVTKGSNIFTEHYSAIQADVPDPEDATTQLNSRLIETLQNADIILVTGQALSHCVKFTVEDIANNFGDIHTQKLHLLVDTMSSVTGFETQGDQFLKDIEARGAKLVSSTDFLK
jgi:nicotinamidase-related amidase